jgi:hypothetical protein
VNASGDPDVPDRDDEEWGWVSYGFSARIYGWKDVREVKDC